MGHTLQIAPATPPTVCCSAGAGADSRSARLGLAEWVCESLAVASHEEDSKQHCQDDGAHAHRQHCSTTQKSTACKPQPSAVQCCSWGSRAGGPRGCLPARIACCSSFAHSVHVCRWSGTVPSCLPHLRCWLRCCRCQCRRRHRHRRCHFRWRSAQQLERAGRLARLPPASTPAAAEVQFLKQPAPAGHSRYKLKHEGWRRHPPAS